MSAKQIEQMARVLASYELFDWASLPEHDPASFRDREAYRQIVRDMILATHDGKE